MSDTVKINVPVEFRKFSIPEGARNANGSVLRQDGFGTARLTPLDELPKEALDALARSWINDLYAKAGKTAPRLDFIEVR